MERCSGNLYPCAFRASYLTVKVNFCFKEIKVIVRDKSADSEGIRWELYSDLIESLWLLCSNIWRRC